MSPSPSGHSEEDRPPHKPTGLDHLPLLGSILLLVINYKIASTFSEEQLRGLDPEQVFGGRILVGLLGALGCPLLVLLLSVLARWVRSFKNVVSAVFLASLINLPIQLLAWYIRTS